MPDNSTPPYDDTEAHPADPGLQYEAIAERRMGGRPIVFGLLARYRSPRDTYSPDGPAVIAAGTSRGALAAGNCGFGETEQAALIDLLRTHRPITDRYPSF